MKKDAKIKCIYTAISVILSLILWHIVANSIAGAAINY